MNCRVQAAGWPFAGLRALETRRTNAVADSARQSGIVARDDGGSGILVYDPRTPTSRSRSSVRPRYSGLTAIPSHARTFAPGTSYGWSRSGVILDG